MGNLRGASFAPKQAKRVKFRLDDFGVVNLYYQSARPSYESCTRLGQTSYDCLRIVNNRLAVQISPMIIAGSHYKASWLLVAGCWFLVAVYYLLKERMTTKWGS